MVRKTVVTSNPHGKLMTPPTLRRFRATVYRAGRAHYRSFPWRATRGIHPSPYRVFVSEFMLQQTQAARVEEPYRAFLKQFPSFKRLATAPLSSVLECWQGLGYNRRAKALHEAAQIVWSRYHGRLPSDRDELVELPGIGPYTAAAIRAFAFNEQTVLIETNIREVFLHHFFPETESVADVALEPYIEATLDTTAPYEWYTALMDYGAYLKRSGSRAARRSSTYKKQSPFKGSGRQVRGAIIRALVAGPSSASTLATALEYPHTIIIEKLDELVTEGLVERRGKRVALAR